LTNAIEVYSAKPKIGIERLAWTILFGSLFSFCSITIATTATVYYFLFLSVTPMNGVLRVARGTAVIEGADFSEHACRDISCFIDFPSIVSTDAQSQSTISFRINDGETTLATLTLKNSTRINLQVANEPRYSWSEGPYFIDLQDFSGEMEVFIGHVEKRQFRIQVQSVDGMIVLMESAGRFSIEAVNGQTRLHSHAGVAALLSANRLDNRLVNSGQEALAFSTRAEMTVRDSPINNLLDNGLFSFQIPHTEASEPMLPVRWQCSSPAEALPLGNYVADVWEGRMALRFVRTENARSHGETGCQQPILGIKQNVQDFNYLELQSTFLINYQSLSECGIEGSECPLMLRLSYIDVNGNARQWYRGFYYNSNPQSNWPRRCGSCDEAHQQINEKVWYTFETGNLFNLLPEDERPAFIEEIKFYASGHQYDVFISELALNAGLRDTVPPTQQLNPINTVP